MADVNRTLVDELFLHHAVTPEWKNKSKAEIAQWFSDNGFARAYGSNPNNWSGLINPFTGQRSYSQTHAVGQMVDNTTPDATDLERQRGYRVFFIIADPWGQITWHAADWAHNCRSIAIENLGDYRNYAPTEGMMEAIADFWRPRDRELGGATNVLLHFEVYATACPARIAEGRARIVELINNPPVAAPVPTPAPTPVSKDVPAAVKLPAVKKFTAKLDKTEVWDLTTNPNYKSVKTLAKGEPFDAFALIEFNGSKYYTTEYAFGKGNKHGINSVDLDEVKQPVVTTKEETTTEDVAFTTKTTEDATLAKGTRLITVTGKKGVRTIVTQITLTDGKETSRTVKSSSITTPPVTEEIVIGTRVDTPKDVEQDARLTVIEQFIDGLGVLIAKIGELLVNWRKK